MGLSSNARHTEPNPLKELTPEKIDVYSVYLISTGVDRDEEVRRRSHLGLFDSSISPQEIKETIQNNLDVFSTLVGSRAFLGDSPVFVDIQDKKIERGIVFESMGECMQYLQHEITYEEICDGFRLNQKPVIEGVQHVDV